MRVVLLLLTLLHLTIGPVHAQGEPGTPDTPEQAAVEALSAFEAEDPTLLKTLAERDDPDPWLVADELCLLGRYDAALAFARAAPRIDTEALPAYVSSRLGNQEDGERRARLTAANEALAAGGKKAALDALGPPESGAIRDIVGVRIAKSRGTVTGALRDYEASSAAYRRAAEAAEELGWLRLASGSWFESGAASYRRTALPAAISAWERARLVFVRREDRIGAARMLGNCGLAYQQMGDFDRALQVLEEVLVQKEQLGDKLGAASTLNNIGSVYQRLGRYAEALATYEISLRDTVALGDEEGAADTLANIGNFHRRLGDHAPAIKAFELALEVLEKTPGAATHVNVLHGLSRIRMEEGDHESSCRLARRAIELSAGLASGLGDEQGARARDLYADVFDQGVRAAVATGSVEDIAFFLESGRAGSLLESLGSRAALEAIVIPSALLQTLNLARHAERRALDAYRLAEAEGKRKAVRAARETWNQAQARVAEATTRIQREAKAAAALTTAAPDDLMTIRSRLGPGEALVLYGMTSEEAVALVVRQDGTRMVALPASAEIDAATDALLAGDRHLDPAKIPALRKLIVSPLKLEGEVTRVLISPMGRLGYVPFSLLFPDHEVVCVPSGTTYGLLKAEATGRGEQILAMGDPDYQAKVDGTASGDRAAGVTALSPLPATRQEVEAIADVSLLGKQATETALQAAVKGRSRWRALHFACHGLVDPERPMRSALALTADQENDGLLTALEIFGMQVPADLIVMSACNTGTGKVYRTEGIVGVTRAFMFAGAPRVICSLWKVDDEATRALMVKFYELWNPKEGEGLPAAGALKQAQEYVRSHEQWKHPCYWAAWVLWGLPE